MVDPAFAPSVVLWPCSTKNLALARLDHEPGAGRSRRCAAHDGDVSAARREDDPAVHEVRHGRVALVGRDAREVDRGAGRADGEALRAFGIVRTIPPTCADWEASSALSPVASGQAIPQFVPSL